MMRAIIAGAVAGLIMAAFLAVLLLVLPAKAQMIACGPVPMVFEALQSGHGEQKAGHGEISNGSAMVLFVNPDTGTWTLVQLIPRPPQACLLSSGKGWETFEPEKESH